MEKSEIQNLIRSEMKSFLSEFTAQQAADTEKKASNDTIKALEAKVAVLETSKIEKLEGDETDENPVIKALETLTGEVKEMREAREKGFKILADRKGSVKEPETETEADTEVDSDGNEWTDERLKGISVDDDEHVAHKAVWCYESDEGQKHLETLDETDQEKLLDVYQRSFLADVTPIS